MTEHQRDPNQRRFTMQELADFARWQVETGKGAWEPGLCLRGIKGIRTNGKGPSLALLPEDQCYDVERKIVFVGARDS